MVQIKLMNIERQHEQNAHEYEQAALSVLRSGDYIMGPIVKEFEKEFVQYVGAQYAIGVGNGTDAIVIALRALGVQQGDEVITVAFTFFATAESVAAVGATPVFVDVCEDNFCMNPDLIEAAITERTKVILPVHFYGHCADMDRINEVAKKHNLYVVEDCAQAVGTLYKGKPVGTFGDVSCFSFFPTKNLGCAGDGGMIVTNNADIARMCRSLRIHGSGEDGLWALECSLAQKGQTLPEDMPKGSTKYYNYLIGYNSRLDTIQAAILQKKLTHLENYVVGRRANAAAYNAALKGTPYKTPVELDYCRHSYYIYALQHDDARSIMKKLNEKGISCGTYYPVPLHLQGVFYELGYKAGDLPISEKLCNTTFAIPVYPELYDKERIRIIAALKEALS